MSQNRKKKYLAFALCYCGQLSRHMMLECWSMAKSHIVNDSISTVWLSSIDSVYLFSYATGNIVSGSIEDRYSLRKMISGGLILSALLFFLISFIGFMEVNNPVLFLILWILQGITQSSIFPGCVAVLGHWFETEVRGKVLGLFVSAGACGNALSAILTGVIFSLGGKWEISMLILSAFELATGILIFFSLQEKPTKLNEDLMMVSLNSEETPQKSPKKKGIPFLQSIFLPNMINFIISMACMKFMYYGLSLWIPFYLSHKIENKNIIGILTALLEIGTLIGTIICGWLGDLIRSRPPVISLFIILSMPFLVALSLLGNSVWVYFFVIPAAGFFAGAPNSIISAVVPIDIAQNSKIDHFEAMATVAGVIDGAGGYGAAIGILILGNLARIGWEYVFAFMLVMGVVAFISLFRISLKGFRNFLSRR